MIVFKQARQGIVQTKEKIISHEIKVMSLRGCGH